MLEAISPGWFDHDDAIAVAVGVQARLVRLNHQDGQRLPPLLRAREQLQTCQ